MYPPDIANSGCVLPTLSIHATCHAGLRKIELAAACRRVGRHILQYLHRRSAHFQPREIESHAEQHALAQIDQVSAGQVPTVISSALYDLNLAAFQRNDLNIGIV
jgi:hypothetical protein